MNEPAIIEQNAASRAVAEIPFTRSFYWSLRRELWENRAIYLAPVFASGLLLLSFMVSLVHLPERFRAAMALPHMEQRALVQQPYLIASLLAMFVTFVIAVIYSIEAFQGERRDRSVLFWKSLPVSDLTAVLAKAAIPILVVPLVTFLVTAAVQFIMLLLSSARLMGSGMVGMLWSHASPFTIWPALLYHLVAIHGLWYAPFYSWFMVVSAWAKRGAWLFAVLPVLLLGFAEQIAFNTHHFAHLIQQRMVGDQDGSANVSGGMSMETMTPMTLGQFLTGPGLWVGLAITAVFIAFAVRMRRYRGPA